MSKHFDGIDARMAEWLREQHVAWRHGPRARRELARDAAGRDLTRWSALSRASSRVEHAG